MIVRKSKTPVRTALPCLVAVALLSAASVSLAQPVARDARTATPKPLLQPTPSGTPHGANEDGPSGVDPQSAPAAHSGAHAGHGAEDDHEEADGFFEAPPDLANEDMALPPGSIEVQLVDAREQPLGDVEVTLGIIENSIAKGENRKREVKQANSHGVVRWDARAQGSGTAYRVTVNRDGATFALPPFQLPLAHGVGGKLHVYPVSRSLDGLRVFSQGSLYCELKDDRLQVEQTITLLNGSPVAWVPKDLVVGLPGGFMAFSSPQGMTDVGLDPVLGQGTKLRGTIGPGRHDLTLRWQLPYDDETSLNFEVGMLPRTLSMQVITAAASGMQLDVRGFEEPKARENEGQRFLITGKQTTPDKPFDVLRVGLSQIPLAGLPPQLRTVLVASTLLAILAAIVYAAMRDRSKTGARAQTTELRAQLLAEVEELERAFQNGDVGPKTYERARRELIDDLARCIGEGAQAKQLART
jgi:hypothetical protein